MRSTIPLSARGRLPACERSRSIECFIFGEVRCIAQHPGRTLPWTDVAADRARGGHRHARQARDVPGEPARYGGQMTIRDDATVKRITLVACILGSGIALLDGTVVNVALPTIQRALGGGLAAQQWVVNGYLLTLGSLILVGGSLGDLFGERRVFALGVSGFGLASAICAAAPSIGVLVAARAVQGVT